MKNIKVLLLFSAPEPNSTEYIKEHTLVPGKLKTYNNNSNKNNNKLGKALWKIAEKNIENIL
jgi:hypothetical protein